MLVPAATSIGMRCSSNQRITPTCAMPLALPPPKATPIFWRSWADAVIADVRMNRAASVRPAARRAIKSTSQRS